MFFDDDKEILSHISTSNFFHKSNYIPDDLHDFRGSTDLQFLVLLYFWKKWEYIAIIKDYYWGSCDVFSIRGGFHVEERNWPWFQKA